jgi:hypothetical protein
MMLTVTVLVVGTYWLMSRSVVAVPTTIVSEAVSVSVDTVVICVVVDSVTVQVMIVCTNVGPTVSVRFALTTGGKARHSVHSGFTHASYCAPAAMSLKMTPSGQAWAQSG